MKGLAELLKLIQKLYGKKAISKTIGTRTNVITLPDKDTKRFVTNELNIDAASDAAVKKAYEDAEKLIPDIPKMNDQEILTLTGNLRRIDNRINPPSAEVIEFGTKQPMSESGIAQLAAKEGLPSDVSPDSPLGRVLQGAQGLRREKEALEKTMKSPLMQFEEMLKDPTRAGGPLDPKTGIVRTAAREILERDLKKGKIEIPDPREREAIAQGYQGGVDPIDVLRKRYGEGILEELDDIADDLNKATDYNQITKMLDEKGLLDKRPKATYGYDEGTYSDEEMRKILSEADEPEEFATGGRVGFAYGSLPKGIQKLYRAINKKFGKGTIKTADELENPKRPLTDEEIKMYEEELGDSETWMSEGTLEEAENALKRREEYEAAMYTDYKAGRLDPKPGEKGRKEFLEQKLEEMEMSGDKKLMTREEIEELSNMDLEAEMEQFKNTKSRLEKKYKGIIDDELLSKMMVDDNPQRLAELEATIDEALKMQSKGMSSEEIISTFQKTPRTKQAGGGLAYLMGL